MEAGLLGGVVLVAAYVRLVNLGHNPGWFADEGTHLEIAFHLQNGRIQYLAIQQSILLFSRLPLFAYLLAGITAVFGLSMLTLRTLTALLGVVSVVVLYGWVRHETGERWVAWLAALLLAVYPQAVLYSRMGFSYNLVAPLLLLYGWGLGAYGRGDGRRWLLLAVTTLALGLLTDLLVISVVPTFLVWVGWHNWRDLGWSVPLVGLPFGVYLFVWGVMAPGAFWFDWQFVLFRVSAMPLAAQGQMLLRNVWVLLGGDVWLLWGGVGCLALAKRGWVLLLLLGMPLLILGRTTPLYHLSFYYMIPFLPLFMVGLAGLVHEGVLFGRRWWGGKTAVLLWLMVAVLIFRGGRQMAVMAQAGWQTSLDPFLLDGEVAQKTADFVNARLPKGALVIGSPGMVWQLNGRRADFQMPAAFDGQATPHLPANLPPERWAFDPSYREADFVVVDNLWGNWAVPHVPGVEAMMATVTEWPLVYEEGEFRVYLNPRK